jgi:hypothetical protein
VLSRFLYDADGRIRLGRLIPLLAVAIFMAIIGSFAVVATTQLFSHPAWRFAWVIFVIFGLKLPLIGLLWWFIRRNTEWPTKRSAWSPGETLEILDYIERQADEAERLPDAPARLAYLSREAWNVADHSSDQSKVDALTVALRIDERAARVGGRRAPPLTTEE